MWHSVRTGIPVLHVAGVDRSATKLGTFLCGVVARVQRHVAWARAASKPERQHSAAHACGRRDERGGNEAVLAVALRGGAVAASAGARAVTLQRCSSRAVGSVAVSL